MVDTRIHEKIQFRLRNVDADLREAVHGMSNEKLAELARDGLRLILGIRTTKRVEIAERPISVAPVDAQPAEQKLHGVGTVWKARR